MAFVAAVFLRPRMGKYDERGSPRPILGHHIPMVMAGAMVLAFGWMGFTSGRSFLANDGRAALIVVNTLVAGASGAMAAALYMSWTFGRPDPSPDVQRDGSGVGGDLRIDALHVTRGRRV